MMRLNAKEDLSLRESVLQTLRQAIVCGELKPGERLMEIQLSEALGVSRTPVRDALRKLEEEGLVIVEKNKGASVAPITEQDLIDVLQVREVLDELSVRLACRNLKKEESILLHKNMEMFPSVIATKDPEKITAHDVEFHDIIYEATGNKRLMQMMHHIQLDMYRYRLEYIRVDEDHTCLYEEHDRIIKAIEKQDEEAARNAIRIHLKNQRETILKNLKK